MKQAISVFGLGYVGSVTAACLAYKGHRVMGVDLNPAKVECVESGRSPVLEPGLQEMAAACRQACRLHATTDAARAIQESDVTFICVGTPSRRNGSLDLSAIERVCEEIGQALRKKNGFQTLVLRSTILPGATESLAIPTLEASSGKRAGPDFAVCVNPEFLREGCAIADFFRPPFTVLGAAHPDHLAPLCALYDWVPARVFQVSLADAEMVKYVCNAFHAVKVSFANEIGTLCKCFGVDTDAVMEMFTSDSKLNLSSAYLTPGFAFGGSCLPKDLRALTYCAQKSDLTLPLLESVLHSNRQHIDRALEAVLQTGKKRVALLGLSFKPDTDDLRESPQVSLVKRLLGEGCQVQIWDDQVVLGRLLGSNRQFIEEVIPHFSSLLTDDLQHAVEAAEIVLVATRAVGNQRLAKCLRPEHTVIDLVNLERCRRVESAASYEGICW
jgi:GDP-mannose 6-dehydrogenase